MQRLRHIWLAWALFSFATVSSIISGFVKLATRRDEPLLLLFGVLSFDFLILPTLAGVGALIFARRPENRIGLLLLIPTQLAAVIALIQLYLFRLVAAPPAATPLLLFLVWVVGWAWLWLVFPLLLIVQLFPSGRSLSVRWRAVAYATVGWAGLFVLILTLSKVYTTVEQPLVELSNPYGLLEFQQLELLIGAVWIPGLLLLTGLSTVALVLRFRRAGPVERGQIKWLLYACTLFAVVYIGGGLLGLAGEATPGGQLYNLFFSLTVLAIPVAIGIAILRHRLFDIDIIIRRTLLYTVLTLTLAGTYFLGVVAFQALLVRFTGQASALAVVASTLAVAALFQPLRAQVQTFIDRRFFRKKYDAQRVLARFAARAQQEADLDTVSADLLGTVQETLEPERVTLWLVRKS